MIYPSLTILVIVIACLTTLICSSLTYALRNYSRVKLGEALENRDKAQWLEATLEHSGELIFVTAVLRLLANMLVFLGVLHALEGRTYYGLHYLLSIVITGVLLLFFSVTIPHSIASHAGERFVARFIVSLHGLRYVLGPLVRVLHASESVVRKIAGVTEMQPQEKIEEQIEQEILSAVEEGTKEGVVDEHERQMISSVIHFHDTTVGQIMTARPEMIGLALNATLDQVKEKIEQSGHSRIPVYDGTVDHIVGVLYARDLLPRVGEPPERFDIRSAMRPAFYVPESRKLRDLLNDFRQKKVHVAIVLDEYGGTAGLVSIEDVMEELVGDISDEHEPIEPEQFKRLSELIAEADARIYVDQLNRLMGLTLPEDAGYDTLAGYVATTLGKIPEKGTTFSANGATFTVLDASPQKVSRVKIELEPQPAIEPAPPGP